jgi:hypothetical protein
MGIRHHDMVKHLGIAPPKVLLSLGQPGSWASDRRAALQVPPLSLRWELRI